MRMPDSLQARAWQNQLVGGMLAFALTLGLVIGGSMAIVGIGGALVYFGLEILRQRRLVWPGRVALGFGGSLLVLVLAGNHAALAPERSWAMTGILVTFVIPLMLLFPRGALAVEWPRWVRHLPWAVMAVLLLLMAELYSGGKILLPLLHGKHDRVIYYNRGLSYAAVLIWPLAALLLHEKRRGIAAGLIALLVLAGWWSASRGAPLALLLGAAGFALAWFSARLALGAGGVLLALVTVLPPFMVPWLFARHSDWLVALPKSWRHRCEIWDYMAAWYWRSPLTGDGVDVGPAVPVGVAGHESLYIYALKPAAHAHHVPLQLLVELGPLGWLWFVLLAGYCLWRIARWPRAARAAGMAAWLAFLTLTCGSFSLWSDSFWSTGALALLFCWGAQAWLSEDHTLKG